MASFMRMPFMLVFYQSKCISAIKRILFYYFHVSIFELIHAFVCSLSLRCMLKPRALRVGVKTLHTMNLFFNKALYVVSVIIWMIWSNKSINQQYNCARRSSEKFHDPKVCYTCNRRILRQLEVFIELNTELGYTSFQKLLRIREKQKFFQSEIWVMMFTLCTGTRLTSVLLPCSITLPGLQFWCVLQKIFLVNNFESVPTLFERTFTMCCKFFRSICKVSTWRFENFVVNDNPLVTKWSLVSKFLQISLHLVQCFTVTAFLNRLIELSQFAAYLYQGRIQPVNLGGGEMSVIFGSQVSFVCSLQ